MDSTLLAGIIGAGATIAAGAVGAWRGKTVGERQSTQSTEKREQTIQQLIGERFGWSAKAVVSTLTVEGGGNAQEVRSWNGIHPGPGMTITQIPGRVVMATPGGKIVGVPRINAKGYAKATRLECRGNSPTHCPFMVEIPAGLSDTDTPLDVDIISNFQGAVLMTRAEVAEAYRADLFKEDYHGSAVEFPIDSLTVEVIFSDTKGVRFYPGVFQIGSEVPVRRELARTESGFTRDADRARFVISEPLLGCTYFIHWTMPT